MRLVIKTGILGFAISISALFSVATAGAIVSGGIGGRPANPDPNNPRTQSIFIYTLDRGASKQDQVLISNNTTKKQTIELYPVDGVVTNTGAYTCRQQSEPRQDLGDWIKLTSSKVTLNAGQSKKVNFTVTMPKMADVGEHDACLVFQNADDQATTQGSVQLHTRQAIRVVATVPGDLKHDVSIQSFTVNKNSGKIMYHLTVKNVGNVSADIDAKVTVKSLFGTTLYSNGGGYPAISSQQLDLSFEQPQGPLFGGWYKAQAKIQYNTKAGQFGTSSTSSNLTTRYSNTKTIFIGPRPLGALIILVVLLLIVGAAVYWFVRRHQRREILQNGHRHTVKAGETIQSIATDYKVSWKKLTTVNNIKPPYTLETGTVLYVLAKRKRS